MTSPAGRRQFMRGQVGIDAEGRYVDPVGGAGLAPGRRPGRGNCLIVVPEDVTALDAGDPVEVLVLDEEI